MELVFSHMFHFMSQSQRHKAIADADADAESGIVGNFLFPAKHTNQNNKANACGLQNAQQFPIVVALCLSSEFIGHRSSGAGWEVYELKLGY